jgi:hypothetical protein
MVLEEGEPALASTEEEVRLLPRTKWGGVTFLSSTGGEGWRSFRYAPSVGEERGGTGGRDPTINMMERGMSSARELEQGRNKESTMRSSGRRGVGRGGMTAQGGEEREGWEVDLSDGNKRKTIATIN